MFTILHRVSVKLFSIMELILRYFQRIYCSEFHFMKNFQQNNILIILN